MVFPLVFRRYDLWCVHWFCPLSARCDQQNGRIKDGKKTKGRSYRRELVKRFPFLFFLLYFSCRRVFRNPGGPTNIRFSFAFFFLLLLLLLSLFLFIFYRYFFSLFFFFFLSLFSSPCLFSPFFCFVSFLTVPFSFYFVVDYVR